MKKCIFCAREALTERLQASLSAWSIWQWKSNLLCVLEQDHSNLEFDLCPEQSSLVVTEHVYCAHQHFCKSLWLWFRSVTSMKGWIKAFHNCRGYESSSEIWLLVCYCLLTWMCLHFRRIEDTCIIFFVFSLCSKARSEK